MNRRTPVDDADAAGLPGNWPKNEMMHIPIRYAKIHGAAAQSIFGAVRVEVEHGTRSHQRIAEQQDRTISVEIVPQPDQ